jgi:hypothetical protein
MMVPKGGLEPPRVTSHAPQTCASTSSATSARSGRMSDFQCLRRSLLSRRFCRRWSFRCSSFSCWRRRSRRHLVVDYRSRRRHRHLLRNTRLQHRSRAGDCGQRKNQREQHEGGGGSDGDLRQQRLCATRPECSARNGTRKQRSGVSLAWLKQDGHHQHNARQNKEPVKKIC